MNENKKKLIFGRRPVDFSLDKHLIVGSWSFLGNEGKFEYQDFEFPEEPLNSDERFQKTEEKCLEIYNYYFSRLVDYLNEINNINKSDKFWKVLISPWLSCLVQSVYEKQLKIDQLVEIYKNSKLEVELVEFQNEVTFKDTNELLVHGLRNIDYVEWIFSQLLKDKLPENWTPIVKKKNFTFDSVDYNFKKALKYKVKEKILNHLALKNVKGIGLVKSFILTLILWFNKSSLDMSNGEAVKVEFDGQLDQIDWWDFILKMMPDNLKHIGSNLPISFSPFIRNVIITSGTEMYTEEKNKLMFADFVERGGRLYVVQHGSNYGYLKYFTLQVWVEYIHSGFITWGWKKQGSYTGNFIPAPVPIICDYLDLREKSITNKDIIFVSTESKPIFDNIMSLLGSQKILQYRKDKITFFQSISNSLDERIKYRPYFKLDYLLEDEQYVKSVLEKEISICTGDLHTAMAQASLIILDNPGTTLHLCLGANIPTICYWRDEDYIFDQDANQLLEKLRSAEILFRTPEEAARKLNSIVNNIQQWWSEEKVQNARKQWCQLHALVDRNWFKRWVQLCRIL